MSYYMDGLEWESRQERDVAIGVGRLLESYEREGFDFAALMAEHRVLARHWPAVIAETSWWLRVQERMREAR